MQSLEPCYNAADVARELRQSWDDRLDYPPTKIPERYLRGDLGVLIELSFEFGGERSACSVLATHNLHKQILRQPVHGRETANDDEFPVLVGNVHIVDDPEQIGPGTDSLVRLMFFNEFAGTGILHPLYLSFVSGEFVFKRWPFFKKGKFDEPEVGGVAVGVIGQFPDDVVQAGPEMVNDLPGENAEARRNLQRVMIVESLRKFLVIELWDFGILAFFKEPGNLHLEVLDVLVGPF